MLLGASPAFMASSVTTLLPCSSLNVKSPVPSMCCGARSARIRLSALQPHVQTDPRQTPAQAMPFRPSPRAPTSFNRSRSASMPPAASQPGQRGRVRAGRAGWRARRGHLPSGLHALFPAPAVPLRPTPRRRVHCRQPSTSTSTSHAPAGDRPRARSCTRRSLSSTGRSRPSTSAGVIGKVVGVMGWRWSQRVCRPVRAHPQ